MLYVLGPDVFPLWTYLSTHALREGILHEMQTSLALSLL